jgi:hypothetical protein
MEKMMKNKTLSFVVIALVTLVAVGAVVTLIVPLGVGSFFAIASSSGAKPTPVVEYDPVTTGYQLVTVEQVKAEVGFGSPIPVQVLVSGNLPDSCAQVELVQQQQEGSNFKITLSTVPSSAEGCIQDSVPFTINIPLNVTNIPTGEYIVEVNGSRTSFKLETGNTTSSLPTADSAITKADVEVAGLNVEIGVGSPIPVHAIVGLNQPNSCAQLGEVRLHREGTIFYVRLIADVLEHADCRVDSIPFRLEIPLNIISLPEGPYEVNVNGVTASFDPRATPAPAADLEDFENQLQAALTQRNVEAIRALMDERFIMAFWQSESEFIPSDEAVTQLVDNYIGEGSYLAFHVFQDIPGFDPQRMIGPDMQLAKAIFVTGWGLDAKSEALLLIARRPDGTLYWHSVLVTPEGFAPPTGQTCATPVEVNAVNGKMSYNGISFEMDPSLASTLAARVCPALEYQENQGPAEAHPPCTQFFFPTYSRQNVDFQPEVRVYEVVGDMQNYPFPFSVLGALQTEVTRRPEPVAWFNGAPLHSRQTYISFKNGSGVRGLVQYMQDRFFYTNNGLTYEFNGLTQDGRYFVSVRYPLGAPFLMEISRSDPLTNVNPQAIAIPDWNTDYEQQAQIIEAYNTEALSRLEQMSDSDTLPNIALLDALVQSIQVIQP